MKFKTAIYSEIILFLKSVTRSTKNDKRKTRKGTNKKYTKTNG